MASTVTPQLHGVAKKRPKVPPPVTGAAGTAPQVVKIPVGTGDTAIMPITSSATQPLRAAANPTPPTTSALPNVADAPPSIAFPEVPDTFDPTMMTMAGLRGHFPNKLELAAMPGALNDLGRFTDYGTVIGNAAASVATLTSSIQVALRWRELRDATATWDEYVKVEDALAWKTAMGQLTEVRPIFLFAVSKNPSLATQYPWLAQLFDAAKVITKQASTTKAKKAKAATAAASTDAANKVAATTAPKAGTVTT